MKHFHWQKTRISFYCNMDSEASLRWGGYRMQYSIDQEVFHNMKNISKDPCFLTSISSISWIHFTYNMRRPKNTPLILMWRIQFLIWARKLLTCMISVIGTKWISVVIPTQMSETWHRDVIDKKPPCNFNWKLWLLLLLTEYVPLCAHFENGSAQWLWMEN